MEWAGRFRNQAWGHGLGHDAGTSGLQVGLAHPFDPGLMVGVANL